MCCGACECTLEAGVTYHAHHTDHAEDLQHPGFEPPRGEVDGLESPADERNGQHQRVELVPGIQPKQTRACGTRPDGTGWTDARTQVGTHEGTDGRTHAGGQPGRVAGRYAQWWMDKYAQTGVRPNFSNAC